MTSDLRSRLTSVATRVAELVDDEGEGASVLSRLEAHVQRETSVVHAARRERELRRLSSITDPTMLLHALEFVDRCTRRDVLARVRRDVGVAAVVAHDLALNEGDPGAWLADLMGSIRDETAVRMRVLPDFVRVPEIGHARIEVTDRVGERLQRSGCAEWVKYVRGVYLLARPTPGTVLHREQWNAIASVDDELARAGAIDLTETECVREVLHALALTVAGPDAYLETLPRRHQELPCR